MDIRTIRVGDIVGVYTSEGDFVVESIIGSQNTVYVYGEDDEEKSIVAVSSDDVEDVCITNEYLESIGCTVDYRNGDVTVYALEIERDTIIIVYAHGEMSADVDGVSVNFSTVREFQHFILDCIGSDICYDL